MTFSTDINPFHRIKPELILQTLGGIKPLEMEMGTKVFKTKKNVESDRVTRNIVNRVITPIPYVGTHSKGVPLNGQTSDFDGITVPPMKAHQRIDAAEFEQVRNTVGKEFNAWLSDQLSIIRETIDWNMEWYRRHFLTDGNCDYPYLINDRYNSLQYNLGTMPVVSAPSVLFDNASATITGVVQHLDTMYEAGQDQAGFNYFRNTSDIIIYARKAVWNSIFGLMEDKQRIDTVTTRRIDIDTLVVGNYTIKKFDGDRIDPETGSGVQSIPAKQMRMIDVSANAKHTQVMLRLANLNATGGQKHVLVKVLQDPNGDFVDINVQFRPVGLFIPNAMVSSNSVIS